MFLEIIKTILLFAVMVILIICFFLEKKFIEFEMPYRERFRRWLSKILIKVKKTIAKRLRKSKRFMKWLYEPSISEQIAEECNNISVRIITDWRNNECKAYCRSFHI